MSPNQPLPQKENAVFKKILRCYENKQYKNGLKLAKLILSNPKYAEHGETLAMKGLLLNCLRRKDEAYDHVKRGLTSDVKSHVCWHVFGLLQRSDRKYDEAIRAYRNALRCDSDNIQILRDLSLLQIQMRDLEGYKETRHKLFTLRPTQKASWIGLAMSYHLLDDHEMAVKLIDEFLKIQNKTSYDYEQSELLLYELQIIFESGNYVEVLRRMDDNAGLIYDKLALMEMRAEVYLRLGNFELAEKLYHDLITRNPENKAFYHGLIKARCLEKDEDKVAMLGEFKQKFARAQIPRRLPLNMSSGETFRSLVDDYMRRAITKGVPPLFVDLQPLYADPQKVKIIEELIEMYLRNIVVSSTFEAAGDGAKPQPVTAVVWTLYLACQHFDYVGDTSRALGLVQRAINHTPTLIELYLAKAKIYKHAGNMLGAVQCLDEAQALDTADRYINSKCAKYMLKAKQLEEAEAMCAKFTRENVSAMENLNEMQCMWYQTECANAYWQLNKFGDALKKCHEVDRHFVEIIEDQFDFHTYCMRKTTLRSYIGLLRLEDVVRGHPFYFKAARIAIKTYLRLYDHPLNDKKAEQDELESTLSKSELKKLRSKQKKAQEKVRQDEKENKDKKVAGNDDDKQEDALNPEKLERPEKPLEEAIRFLRPLQELSPKNIETHLLAYEIYKRNDKPLLMLQCLKRAHRLQPDHPTLHVCMAHFLSTVANKELTGPVKSVVDKQLSSLFLGKQQSAKELNSSFLQQHRDSYPHAIAAATVLYQLDKTKQAEALKLLHFESDPLIKLGVSRERCEEVMALLKDGSFGPMSTETIDAFVSSCARRFPLAEAFQTNPEVIQSPSPDACSDNTAEQKQTT